jgi:hypothetical protein
LLPEWVNKYDLNTLYVTLLSKSRMVKFGRLAISYESNMTADAICELTTNMYYEIVK